MATVELKHRLRNPIDMSKWITIWTAKLDPTKPSDEQVTEITPASEFKLPANQIYGSNGDDDGNGSIKISPDALPSITVDDLPKKIPASKIDGYNSEGDTFTFLNQKGEWLPISAPTADPISISALTNEDDVTVGVVISHTNSGVTADTYGLDKNYTGETNNTPFNRNIYIPQITVDSKGHITSIAAHYIKMKQNNIGIAGYVPGTGTGNAYKNKVWGTASDDTTPEWRGIATSESYLYTASATSKTVQLGGTSSTSPIYVTGTTLCIQNTKVVTGDAATAVTLTTQSKNAITIA